VPEPIGPSNMSGSLAALNREACIPLFAASVGEDGILDAKNVKFPNLTSIILASRKAIKIVIKLSFILSLLYNVDSVVILRVNRTIRAGYCSSDALSSISMYCSLHVCTNRLGRKLGENE